jgi:hypothetical protein
MADVVLKKNKSPNNGLFGEIEYWLKRVEDKSLPRTLTACNRICKACEHVSASFKWCCIDRVNLVGLENISIPPTECPYVLELTMMLQDDSQSGLLQE